MSKQDKLRVFPTPPARLPPLDSSDDAPPSASSAFTPLTPPPAYNFGKTGSSALSPTHDPGASRPAERGKRVSITFGGVSHLPASHYGRGSGSSSDDQQPTSSFTSNARRRASYAQNNVFVPLGLRKLNALAGSNGATGPGHVGESAALGNGASHSDTTFSQSTYTIKSDRPWGPSIGGDGKDDGGGGLSAGGGPPPPAFGQQTPQSLVPFNLPPNFGSHVQLFVNNVSSQKSLVVKKKEIYAQLSIIFGIVLCAFVLVDYIFLLVKEHPSGLKEFLLSIQILHVGAFYLFLLGFIYANEAGDLHGLKTSILAFLINLTAFVARCTFELTFADYMAG
ncbi:hypothetical protein RI367_003964 [Sorochytrium milnesiophthora]